MADKMCRFRHGHSTRDKQYRVDDVEILSKELAEKLAGQRIVDIEGDAPKLKTATATEPKLKKATAPEPSRKAVTR